VRLDTHTPCPACPAPVQDLFSAAQALITALEGDLSASGVCAAIETTRAALQRLAPHVEAHFANQAHAYAAELAGVRRAMTEATLVLERGLLFDEREPGQEG
jgi:hypothetical protein